MTMTLDEAIIHFEKLAEEDSKNAEHIRDKMKSEIALYNADKLEACAEANRQLAGWLEELKSYRERGSVTNGDVIKAMFPDAEVTITRVGSNENVFAKVGEQISVRPLEFWNAPCGAKMESEG